MNSAKATNTGGLEVKDTAKRIGYLLISNGPIGWHSNLFEADELLIRRAQDLLKQQPKAEWMNPDKIQSVTRTNMAGICGEESMTNYFASIEAGYLAHPFYLKITDPKWTGGTLEVQIF